MDNGRVGERRTFGLVCALREELGSLRERARPLRRELGHEVLEIELEGHRLLLCESGVGKVAAARAAAALVASGVEGGMLVGGTCGGLVRRLVPGTLVHCTRAVQTDLAVRAGRESQACERLRAAWLEVAGGEEGWFLTADRPVLSLWRRLRLARAFAGPAVADMETAAVAAVADAAGVPWAALRAVTDGATGLGAVSFKLHFPSQAGRAADTVPALLARLGRAGPP
jgi:adenosylhomocysteine nucleosidase